MAGATGDSLLDCRLSANTIFSIRRDNTIKNAKIEFLLPSLSDKQVETVLEIRISEKMYYYYYYYYYCCCCCCCYGGRMRPQITIEDLGSVLRDSSIQTLRLPTTDVLNIS
jgi:hypothetical protein